MTTRTLWRCSTHLTPPLLLLAVEIEIDSYLAVWTNMSSDLVVVVVAVADVVAGCDMRERLCIVMRGCYLLEHSESKVCSNLKLTKKHTLLTPSSY